jgi:WD40 repeat protein
MAQKRDIKDFNPFPGLRPFATEDSNLFFGREEESNEVLLKLLKNRCVTVIGTSGIGKSSLIYGGVLPKIRSLKIGESSEWRIISFRPGTDPFGNLASAISDVISNTWQKSVEKDLIFSDLLDNHQSLSDIVRKYFVKNDDKVLLVIDQFEELFRYLTTWKSESSAAVVKRFVDFLTDSFSKPDENVHLIMMMRSEYLEECSHYKELTLFINNSNYIVPVMGIEGWRKIIEGPINFTGEKIEPELVDILLNDIKKQTNRLPVLQHVLMRTWASWKKLDMSDRPISKSDYDTAGTMDFAISLHADEVYKGLDQRDKEICGIMFKTITRKGSDKKGLRQPSDIESIRSVAGCSKEELLSVVLRFMNQTLSFLLSSEDIILNENPLVDLRYECLIHLWDRLKIWVDEEAFSKENYLRLSEASALYQQGKTGLLRPPDLQEAINWRNKFKPVLSWAVQYNPAFERALVYLRTSEKEYIQEEQNKIRLEKRKIKRTRIITGILGFVVLMATGLIFLANVQKTTAVRKSILAEEQRIKSVREKAVADSFAVIVYKHNIISDSTASAASKDAAIANERRIVADVQKSLAERKAEDALRQRNLNEKQKEGIQRLRMLSVSKSMSLRSLQMEDQKDLQTLLAYQAYLFNKKNNGAENDADIYAGLYNALRNGSISCKSFKGHNGAIRSIAFLPGVNEFFTSGTDGKILKWSLDKNDQTLQIIYSGSDIIDVLAVSPDASWLACGSSNSSIRMIPLKDNNIGYEMNGHKGGIKSLVFSYDGRYLYSAALDGKVLKWDIAAKTSVNVSDGSMEISSIDISSKGTYLAGVSTDGNVVVWNPERSSDNFRIETAGKNIKVVRFNPENNLLAIGDADGNVELWDIGLHKMLSKIQAHSATINDIQFNTKLKQMATAGNDNKLKLFNISDPADLSQPPVTLADNNGFVVAIQFSPDGQMIISGESAGGNLLSRPSHVDFLVQDICNIVTRNMTREEWNLYVGKDIPVEKTCLSNTYNIKVEPIKSNSK